MSANQRFVYGPYSPLAYPNQRYYPAYVYPKQSIPATPQSTGARSLTSKQPQVYPPMRPYVFRSYIPPSYYEMWDYNKADLAAAEYNESIRAQIAGGGNKHTRRANRF
jgi:hypothetical protein